MPRSKRAFTILELIFVITAILILASLVLVSFHKITSAANNTASASALRQIITAWSNYNADHDGRLLPGYINPADFTDVNSPWNGMIVRNENGDQLVAADRSSYVWRLAPYLGYKMDIFAADYKSSQITAKFDTELLNHQYGPGTVNPASGELGIALVPSFGINSIFVGGNDYQGGSYVTDRTPWRDSSLNPNGEVLAATRFSQIKNASTLIVFGPTAQANLSMLPNINPPPVQFGSPELRPPYIEYNSATGEWMQEQWALDVNNATDAIDDLIATGGDISVGEGVPISRWNGSNFPTAQADGSVGTQDTRDYYVNPSNTAQQQSAYKRKLMAAWWPFATGLN
ncbi:MAG TPA: type II secretion system protein [Phycisphaerales bacterium]|nr:type II secretion system protein [Phycisphaerales bacterium]